VLGFWGAAREVAWETRRITQELDPTSRGGGKEGNTGSRRGEAEEARAAADLHR
jgi:hypothetical protein